MITLLFSSKIHSKLYNYTYTQHNYIKNGYSFHTAIYGVVGLGDMD